MVLHYDWEGPGSNTSIYSWYFGTYGHDVLNSSSFIKKYYLGEQATFKVAYLGFPTTYEFIVLKASFEASYLFKTIDLNVVNSWGVYSNTLYNCKVSNISSFYNWGTPHEFIRRFSYDLLVGSRSYEYYDLFLKNSIQMDYKFLQYYDHASKMEIFNYLHQHDVLTHCIDVFEVQHKIGSHLFENSYLNNKEPLEVRILKFRDLTKLTSNGTNFERFRNDIFE